MKKFYVYAGAVAICLMAGVAWAAGVFTGFPSAAFPLTTAYCIPADTGASSGNQTVCLTPGQLKGYWRAPVALTSSTSTYSLDASLSDLYTLTTSQNSMIGVPTNPTSGQTIRVAFTSGGSYTVAWAGGTPTFVWAGGSAPTISTTSGWIDIVTLTYNGTKWVGSVSTGAR